MVSDAGQGGDVIQQRLRMLPAVDEVLKRPLALTLVQQHGRPVVVRAVRAALQEARATIQAGAEGVLDDVTLTRALEALMQPSLRRVINATGVVLHTNLGRAPLPQAALDAVVRVGAGYSNLEFDVATGERGSRYVHAAGLLRELLGVEDALVVNNCAAAVLLALSSLCNGKEAIVSRGELVEIGGAFRIPDVIQQGGAILKEVGTTNRTRAGDYEQALGPHTGALLKVHQSNFAVVGFTESVDVTQLQALGKRAAVPVLVDLGTGRLTLSPGALGAEPTVQDVVKAGADLVMFSADKLLGGPQAGILAGRAALVERCRRHPLCRALRVDKLTLAALEATLRLHRDGRDAEIPALAMLAATPEMLRARARGWLDLVHALPGVTARLVEVTSRPGGGTLPLVEIPSVALGLRVEGCSADGLASRLRALSPPVVARTQEDELLLDPRCVLPDEDTLLQRVLLHALTMVHDKPSRRAPPC